MLDAGSSLEDPVSFAWDYYAQPGARWLSLQVGYYADRLPDAPQAGEVAQLFQVGQAQAGAGGNQQRAGRSLDVAGQEMADDTYQVVLAAQNRRGMRHRAISASWLAMNQARTQKAWSMKP